MFLRRLALLSPEYNAFRGGYQHLFLDATMRAADGGE